MRARVSAVNMHSQNSVRNNSQYSCCRGTGGNHSIDCNPCKGMGKRKRERKREERGGKGVEGD